MKRPPRIVRILKVEPFRVMTLWTNGEIRENDFADKLSAFEASDRLRSLMDFSVFSQVSVSESDTLCWQNLLYINTKGKQSYVMFDPDVLYVESQEVNPSPIIEIDTRHEFTQSDYARRKGLSASKVRAWVNRGKIKSRYVPHLDLTLVVE